ncbi:hypothetical protein IAT38_002523 [Cryptococcus sp. DSM 104549]
MSFASRPLESLGLPKEMLEAANRANLTPSSILLTPLPQLVNTLKCKIPFAQDLVSTVARAMAPEVRRCDIVLDEDGLEGMNTEGDAGGVGQGGAGGVGADGSGAQVTVDGEGSGRGRGKWISTGDEGMDRCLGGGLRRGCLYELTGESAAGKSHFALMLALACQLPALSSSPGGSLILTSERELSTDRLVQLAKSVLATHEQGQGENATDMRVKGLLDEVLTTRATDVDALIHALNYAIPALLDSRLPRPSTTASSPSRRQAPAHPLPIRLLIIDSLTALFRGGSNSPSDKPTATSSVSLTERSKQLNVITDLVKHIAVHYDLAVVVINQVSDVFSRAPSGTSAPSVLGTPPSSGWAQTQPFGPSMGGGDPPMLYATQARWFSGQSETLKKEASLGLVWANVVNVRIMLSRTGRRRMLHQSDLRPAKRRRPSDSQPEGEGLASLGMDVAVDEVKPTLLRRMHVVFSPFGPSGTVDYAITPSGVHSLPDSYQVADAVESMKKRRGEWRMEVATSAGENGIGVDSGTAPAVWEAGREDGREEMPASDDYGEEVFDDFGDLPEEFWEGVLGGGDGLAAAAAVAAAAAE